MVSTAREILLPAGATGKIGANIRPLSKISSVKSRQWLPHATKNHIANNVLSFFNRRDPDFTTRIDQLPISSNRHSRHLSARSTSWDIAADASQHRHQLYHRQPSQQSTACQRCRLLSNCGSTRCAQTASKPRNQLYAAGSTRTDTSSKRASLQSDILRPGCNLWWKHRPYQH